MDFITNNISPKHNEGLPFIWYTKLSNGEIVTEYDNDGNHYDFFKNLEENYQDFVEMGLLGNGGKVYINPDNGEFVLSNDIIAKLSILDEDGETYCVTSNNKAMANNLYRKNFVSRKYVSYDLQPNRSAQTLGNDNIESITMGYRLDVVVDGVKLDILVQYGLALGRSQFIELDITPEEDFKGTLILKYGTGNNEEKGFVEIAKGATQKMMITF